MTIVNPVIKANPRVYPEGNRRSGVNGMAVVAAISAVLLFVVPVVPLFCGGIARSQIRRTGESGQALAAFAVAIGVAGSAVWLVLWGMVLAYKGINVTLPALPF